MIVLRDDASLRVIGIAFLAPANRKPIELAAVHDERNGFGGFAECDWQRTGCERIERAGVACAFGIEQPLHDADRMR